MYSLTTAGVLASCKTTDRPCSAEYHYRTPWTNVVSDRRSAVGSEDAEGATTHIRSPLDKGRAATGLIEKKSNVHSA